MSIETIREVSVDCHFFLLCSTTTLLFVFRYRVFTDSKATFSHTLDKTGNKEIGLLFPGSSKSPPLKIGDTSRIHQVLVVKEEFIIAAIYRRNNYNYRYKVLDHDDTSWYLVKTWTFVSKQWWYNLFNIWTINSAKNLVPSLCHAAAILSQEI